MDYNAIRPVALSIPRRSHFDCLKNVNKDPTPKWNKRFQNSSGADLYKFSLFLSTGMWLHLCTSLEQEFKFNIPNSAIEQIHTADIE